MRSNASLPSERDRVVRSGRALALAAALSTWFLVSGDTMPHYIDDTYATLQGARHIVEIRGEQGFKRVEIGRQTDATGAVLDTRGAIFTVANSRNAQPTAALNCDQGSLPVNRYPLLIDQQDHTAVVGGLFLSLVPQASEWQDTYCNSAAITFANSAGGVVDGVRIAGAWDAIRMSVGSPDLLIANSWVSNARDDAVEDDFLQPATIRDTLIDGAFQGFSVKPRKSSDTGDASDRLVTLSAVLLRLGEYGYKEQRRFGALLKSDQRAPRVQMVNSVVAVDYLGGRSYPEYWATSWAKLTASSSNNLFLWMSDAPIPSSVPLPPSSFRVLRGQAARDAWVLARTNWINCHPKLARLPTDRSSEPDRCVPGTWGGFTE